MSTPVTGVAPSDGEFEAQSNIEKFIQFQQHFVDQGDEAAAHEYLHEDFEITRTGLGSAFGALLAAGDIDMPQFQAESVTKIEGIVQAKRAIHSSFREWRHHSHKLIAAGDVVSGHWELTARHSGDLFGIPATGRVFSFSEAGMVRFKDGKLIELWFMSDGLEFLRGLGYAIAGKAAGDAENWSEHPSVARIRRHYAAISARDLDAIASGYASNVVWHGVHAPQGEQVVGRDAVMQLYSAHFERSSDTAHHQVQDVVGNGQNVISFLRYRAERPDGRVIEGTEAQVHRLGAGGLIEEIWTFLDDPQKFRDWQQAEPLVQDESAS